MVVLLQKGYIYYRGVGPFQVLIQTIYGLIKQRLGASVRYHDSLHGFRPGRFMETTSIEDKLIQDITGMREEVLYKVIIYLNKAYDTLDRDRSMKILVE